MDQDLVLSKLRPTEPRGSIYLDQYFSEESGDEDHAPRLVAKKIKKLGYRKKKYKIITNKMREELIDAIENQNEKIKDAAKRLHMNYSSAKSILQVYKKEGRLNKKGFRRKSGSKTEFAEDGEEDEESEDEVVEKIEFVKQESSPVISIRQTVSSEEAGNQTCEETTTESSQRTVRAKAQLIPKTKSPCQVASILPIKEIPEPASAQILPERANYLNGGGEMSQFNLLPNSSISIKNNLAAVNAVNNNSFYSKIAPYNNSMMNLPSINFQGLYANNPADNFAFKNGANPFQNLGIQKPLQRNNLYQRQDNPVFMQNLIQTNFFPSQYIANNGYWNPLLMNNNQLVRPVSNHLVGNFGSNLDLSSLAQYPKVEESDI